MATINIYNKFKLYLADGTIDMDNDQFKIALLDSNHSFMAASSISEIIESVSLDMK